MKATIDNGTRHRLQIGGVFDGICGISRGVIAFVPNRRGKQPESARGGILDDEPVRLFEIAKSADGPAYTCRFEIIE